MSGSITLIVIVVQLDYLKNDRIKVVWLNPVELIHLTDRQARQSAVARTGGTYICTSCIAALTPPSLPSHCPIQPRPPPLHPEQVTHLDVRCIPPIACGGMNAQRHHLPWVDLPEGSKERERERKRERYRAELGTCALVHFVVRKHLILCACQ